MQKYLCEIVVPDGFDPSDLLEQIQALAREIFEENPVQDEEGEDIDQDFDEIENACSVQILETDAEKAA